MILTERSYCPLLPYADIRAQVEAGIPLGQIRDRLLDAASFEDLRSWAHRYVEVEVDRLVRNHTRDLEQAAWAALPEVIARKKEAKAAQAAELQEAEAEGFTSVAAWRRHRAWVRREAERKRLEEGSVRIENWLAKVKLAMDFTDSLLASEFALGDGRRVTWGEATPAEHRDRIEMMHRQIDGCERDLELHSRVLEALVSSGASSLNDLRTRTEQAAA